MEQIFNNKNCRVYGNNSGSGFCPQEPRLMLYRNGKFSLTRALSEGINADYVEFVYDENKLYVRASNNQDGFKLSKPNKDKYRYFNSIGLLRALSSNVLKVTDKKRIKSASYKVTLTATANVFEINIAEPTHYVEEFNPDSKC